jgi:lysophospholipase L1-like esterase
MFSNDGLHPSETSQRRLAKIIAGALTPLLAARGLAKPRSGA